MKKTLIFLSLVFLFKSVSSFSNGLSLEAIGAFGASNIYLTYLSMGVLADGYENKVYEKNRAQQAVQEILSLASVSKNYLEKLIKERVLTGDDVRFGREMIRTYNLLIQEGNAFVRYISSNNRRDAEEFQSYRKQAWDKISALLGLKK